MKNPKVSIIIPTRKRAHLLQTRVEAIIENTPELRENELIFATDYDDQESFNVLASFGVVSGNFHIVENQPLEIPAVKWNHAAKYARGEWLVTLSDDCIPAKGWLTKALDTKNYGFLGLPDGVTGDRNKQFTPLYMATKEWLKKWNGGVLVIPFYKSWYADIETCWRAHNSLTYAVAWDSEVKQLHKIFGSAEDDDMYKLGESRQAEDKVVFEARKAERFPDNFERVL